MDRQNDTTMALDDELLKKARTAHTSLSEAERQAALARAEYNTAIRRLHLGGASFREIAEALELSHQRVQQIVSAAGGTWWQRMWKTRNTTRDLVCTFCERPPSEVSKLLAGPDVYICDACVDHAARAIEGSKRQGRFAPAAPHSKVKCSFCGKARTEARRIATTSAGNVCGDCVQVSKDILEIRG